MTPRTVRALWVAGAAALAITIVGIYRAGLDELAPPPNDTNVVAAHGGMASGERIKFRSWTAHYDRMVANADQTVVDLYGVRNGTIFRGGKPYLRVDAAHMTVNTVTHDFTATGPLHIDTYATHPSRSFDTDSATWSDATQRLTFSRKTTIVSGADAPLIVGSMVLNVKTGDADVRAVSGSVRFK